jgi:peptidoglycan-associated lipoprotein
MTKPALVVAAAGLSALAALACSACGDPPPAPKQPVVTATPTKPTTTEVTSAPAKTENMAVNVDDQIAKLCDLKFSNIEDAPKFDYDSESLTQGERDILAAVAKCLTTGPLKGRQVELVGRAGTRGETEYNMTLGAKRARAVHGFMTSLGVPGDKMRETSRGELDATGKDEEGWRKDRRVDVRLVK